MSLRQLIFIPLFLLSALLFVQAAWSRLRLVRLGAPTQRFDRPGRRLAGMLEYAFAQERVLQRPYGWVHGLLFWSFLVLLLVNGEFLLSGLIPSFSLAFLPTGLYHALLVAFDVVSLLVLVCVAVAFVRRLACPPDYLQSSYITARSGEALLILGLIATLMVAYFVLSASEIVLGGRPGGVMPLSGALAGLLPAQPHLIANVAWWVHAAALLLFMILLPRSKHMHILTAIPNCFLRNLGASMALPRESFAKGKNYGADRVERLSWKDLLDGFACTECGRCQDVCPARATEKPLNPRQVVHDIKLNLLENGPRFLNGQPPNQPLIGNGGEGSVSEEALWACTTCGACLSVCPVLIEHPQKIVQLRRHLVQMEARFPAELLNLFENSEQRSNPWGIAPSERSKWCSQIATKPFVAGETEYLFFVGCAGAFDNRNKQVTLALATLLDRAGLSWGILGRDEKCCGDSLRRLGNEYVFEQMALANVAQLKEKGVTKIITQCPHCFTTLKNDYAQYGLTVEVRHHSELLAELLTSGRLKLGKDDPTVKDLLYHDSCYLARHNGVQDAPRQALAAATGRAPREFEKHGQNAFCCGAGGGRMWMEEEASHRINVARVRQALEKQPDTVCVACPYCLTMFEDGLKDEQVSNVRVQDLAEVLARRL
jgi:Fe-S oxidoreductase